MILITRCSRVNRNAEHTSPSGKSRGIFRVSSWEVKSLAASHPIRNNIFNARGIAHRTFYRDVAVERSHSATMTTPFIPRALFPPLTSLPRSYYLGHHAAGLSKMRTLLNQIDLIIECRDYRIPLTSRNPMFEDVLSERERIVVYTKKDLGSNGNREEDKRVCGLIGWI